jgi:shikimate kinase
MEESEKPLDVKGQIGEKQLTWIYDIVYQSTTYTLTYTGALDSAATSIKGTIVVDPSDADGDFTAAKQ